MTGALFVAVPETIVSVRVLNCFSRQVLTEQGASVTIHFNLFQRQRTMTMPKIATAIAGMVCTFCGERMQGGEDVFPTTRQVPHTRPSWLNPDGMLTVQGVAHVVCPDDEPVDDPARWSFIDGPSEQWDSFAEQSLDHRAPID